MKRILGLIPWRKQQRASAPDGEWGNVQAEHQLPRGPMTLEGLGLMPISTRGRQNISVLREHLNEEQIVQLLLGLTTPEGKDLVEALEGVPRRNHSQIELIGAIQQLQRELGIPKRNLLEGHWSNDEPQRKDIAKRERWE